MTSAVNPHADSRAAAAALAGAQSAKNAQIRIKKLARKLPAVRQLVEERDALSATVEELRAKLAAAEAALAAASGKPGGKR
jgi:PII-like signaling protein